MITARELFTEIDGRKTAKFFDLDLTWKHLDPGLKEVYEQAAKNLNERHFSEEKQNDH